MSKICALPKYRRKRNFGYTLRLLWNAGKLLGILFHTHGSPQRKFWTFLHAFTAFTTTLYFTVFDLLVYIGSKAGATKTEDAGSEADWYQEKIFLHTVIFLDFFTILSLVVFMQLSQSWHCLMEQWERLDEELFSDYVLSSKAIEAAIGLFIGLAICTVYFVVADITSEPGGLKSFSELMKAMEPQIAIWFSLGYPTGILVSVIFICYVTLVKFFTELFTSVVSGNLAYRLKLFKYILNTNKKTSSDSRKFWKRAREDYTRLCNLVLSVDDQIGPLILTSYAKAYLGFLDILTFFFTWQMKGIRETLYFLLIVLYWFAKFFVETLFASWINEESHAVMRILNTVPAEDYNSEVIRFELLASFDEVALTGCKMFRVNRSLCLQVLNAAILYELMVIQFNTAEHTLLGIVA